MNKVLKIEKLQHPHIGKESLSFSLKRGEILCLLGASGCGKTSLLDCIAGFKKPSLGQIVLNEQIICDKSTFIPPEKRKIAYVFQEHSLFPHLNIERNIAYALKEEKNRSVKAWLDIIGLPNIEEKYPHQLSGGEKQRVAIARALAPKPNLILFDEPFSHLDQKLRCQLREDIRNILKSQEQSAIFVTHDKKEAERIGDRILHID